MNTPSHFSSPALRLIQRRSLWGPALLGGLLPFSAPALAEDEQPPALLAPVVVTGVAPSSGPVIEANPKQPRQPVPASDATDYLKTIPGFSAIRSGGSNGDPVLRGQFGSRLNLLVDGGSYPGTY